MKTQNQVAEDFLLEETKSKLLERSKQAKLEALKKVKANKSVR